MRLILASRNPGKLAELEALLRERGRVPVEVVPLPEGAPEVQETGSTFAENARLKAERIAEWAGEWALADDSGLEVDALGGAPGIHSSRYAGPGAGDTERIAKLLDALRDVPSERRGARFRCAVAVAAPDGRTWTVEGACEGVIASAPRGEHGFGYDPVFYFPDRGRTFAELPPEEKNRVSHRARALASALTLLQVLHRQETG